MEGHLTIRFDARDADACILFVLRGPRAEITALVEHREGDSADYDWLHSCDITELYLRYIQSAQNVSPTIVIRSFQSTLSSKDERSRIKETR